MRTSGREHRHGSGPDARPLPTGIVTFLLSDVEGSTRLWASDPESMQTALERHDTVVEGSVRDRGGVLVRPRGEGDSRFAVFELASDAVAAALEAQRALTREAWPPSTPIRVRMALHTGEAGVRAGDYYGTTVNRCARLRAIAWGGQTIMSRATAEIARQLLPDCAELVDLGLHRLKDLAEPERVFGLLHPDLPGDFRPLASLDAGSHNLPLQLTSFVDRDEELSQVRKLMEMAPVLTLMGPGGVGKTRLALQAAAESVDAFADGVWFVDLASLVQPEQVAEEVARVLGLREGSGRSIPSSLVEHLRGRQTLILLDNCEHLVEACATLFAELLRACEGVKVLATSRERLGLEGEFTYLVPSLAVPTDEELPGEALAGFPSVRLFLDRSAASGSEVTLTHAAASSIAHICRALDGIPLAIELAASRSHVLRPSEIADRLKHRLAFLTGGPRTASPRQRTLRAAIDWSHDLLSGPERTLFRRLVAFAGGFSLEGAEAVRSEGAVDLLTSLVDRSLIVTEGGEEGPTRFRMLEILREYAWERLREAGEEEEVRRRHLAWVGDLVTRAEAEMSGAGQSDWFGVLEREHENIRAALDWAEQNDPLAGLAVAASLGRFWDVHGHFSEGRARIERALASVAPGPSPDRSKALMAAGNLARAQGDYAAARSFIEESMELRRELGDERNVAICLLNLGNIVQVHGDVDEARRLFEQGLEVLLRLGEKEGAGACLLNLGILARDRGDHSDARTLFDRSVEIFQEIGHRLGLAAGQLNRGRLAYAEGDFASARRFLEEDLEIRTELGDRRGVAISLTDLGRLACAEGDMSTARTLLEGSLATRSEMGDRVGVAYCLSHLGKVALASDDVPAARPLLEESLELLAEMEDVSYIPDVLEGLARVWLEDGDPYRAARLVGAAASLRAQTDTPIPVPERAVHEALVRSVADLVGADDLYVAGVEGASLTQTDAIALALADGKEAGCSH